MHRGQIQDITAAFIGEAQTDALAGRRDPHQLTNGDVGGITDKCRDRNIAGISTKGGWAAAASGSGASGTMAAGVTGITTPGGGGIGEKPQAPTQFSLVADSALAPVASKRAVTKAK